MVSRSLVIFFAAVTVWAQTATSPLAVRQENSVPSQVSQPNPKSNPRNARRHPDGAKDVPGSRRNIYDRRIRILPVIVNKIGIAYHQMMNLDLARKHYERAVKLDPKYSEAINNLGTVYYAAQELSQSR